VDTSNNTLKDTDDDDDHFDDDDNDYAFTDTALKTLGVNFQVNE
jgi:hypothetical protein